VNPVVVAPTTSWPGDRWPPDRLPVTWPNMPLTTGFFLKAAPPTFRNRPGPGLFCHRGAWRFRAGRSLGRWDGLLDGVTLPNAAAIKAELVELAQLVYYRPSALAEAMAQNSGILQYFSGILDFNLPSRTATVYPAVSSENHQTSSSRPRCVKSPADNVSPDLSRFYVVTVPAASTQQDQISLFNTFRGH
jgi:hypothetical protein